MKILITSWVNIAGVLVVVFLYAIYETIALGNGYNIFQLLLAASISIFLYGFMAWMLFMVSLIVLDILLFARNKNYLKSKLFVEWLIISSPFIYWLNIYREWVFLVAVLGFGVTQFIREKMIRRLVMEKPDTQINDKGAGLDGATC